MSIKQLFESFKVLSAFHAIDSDQSTKTPTVEYRKALLRCSKLCVELRKELAVKAKAADPHTKDEEAAETDAE